MVTNSDTKPEKTDCVVRDSSLTTTTHRIAKFALTGISGVMVNLGTFQLMIYLGVHELIASPIAIELSIISNFLLNNFWTFNDRNMSDRKSVRGLKYHLVSFGTLTLSYGSFVTMIFIFSEVPSVILQGAAIAPAALFNYSVNSLWTFREQKSVGN